jgi:hypothetical protein
MKKSNPTSTDQLAVRRETIAHLTSLHLSAVVGGVSDGNCLTPMSRKTKGCDTQ